MLTRLILDTKPFCGAWNMAADDFLAKAINRSRYNAILRFYRWSPPAVSLGINQTSDVIDLEKASKLGWDVVYRPTGGRMLLHLNDLSYSFIRKCENDPLQHLGDVYRGVSNAIQNALAELGVTTEVEGSAVKPDPRLRASRLCLNTAVRGEVHYQGKKIVGSAQKIGRNSILQHGSFLIEGDPASICLVLPGIDENDATRFSAIRERAICLEEVLGSKVDVKNLIVLLTESLCDTFGLDLVESDFSESERNDIENSINVFKV